MSVLFIAEFAPGELVRVGGAHDVVAHDLGVDDLADDVLVGEADHEPVLGGPVLVLVLSDEPLPRVVVRLALSPPPELHLVPLEVGLRASGLHYSHSRAN